MRRLFDSRRVLKGRARLQTTGCLEGLGKSTGTEFVERHLSGPSREVTGEASPQEISLSDGRGHPERLRCRSDADAIDSKSSMPAAMYIDINVERC